MPMNAPFPIDEVRALYPALGRQIGGQPVVYFDGPAGSQTPLPVVEAQSRCMTECNANLGGYFATSRESDAMFEGAQVALAELLNGSADEVVFGANMTSLTFSLSSALARGWSAGDEVVVTRLDHEANVTPWVSAAADAGAVVRHVDVDPADCTLDLSHLHSLLGPRTRLVAVTAASNLVGSRPPIAGIAEMVHAAGAELFVDAVHYAPHDRIDVAGWGCDYLACSAYKFFGPHVGVLWGRSELLESAAVRKLKCAPDAGPGRWMQGTQNHEGIAAAAAAVDYLAGIGRKVTGTEGARQEAVAAAFDAIAAYERELVVLLIGGLREAGFRVWGITDEDRYGERTPTVAITHDRHGPRAIAEHLASRGIFAWSGNNYALPLTEALGLEPEGVVRLGLLHYNTREEVVRVTDELRAMAS